MPSTVPPPGLLLRGPPHGLDSEGALFQEALLGSGQLCDHGAIPSPSAPRGQPAGVSGGRGGSPGSNVGVGIMPTPPSSLGPQLGIGEQPAGHTRLKPCSLSSPRVMDPDHRAFIMMCPHHPGLRPQAIRIAWSMPGLQAWEPPWRVDPSHNHQIQGEDRARGWALRDPRPCPKGQYKSLVLATQLGISQKSFPLPLTPPP